METNSVNLLLKAFNFSTKLEKNHDFDNKIYHSLGCALTKKWIGNIVPLELLEKNIKEIIDLIATISEDCNFYSQFPNFISTPDYGDNWGRFANYFELNDRAIAKMCNNKTCCGLINSIKILPAIPPSAKSWANCVILSQIFQNMFGDGYNKAPDVENSLYALKINCPYSENIIDYNIASLISPENQLRAFCDLAHFRGLKVGFRMMISADQIKVVKDNEEQNFSWENNEHLEIFINECTKLMNLGFEAMFVDSAKHIGGYEMENYTGVGALPSYSQAQYIFHEIRKRSGKTNISFIGEKTTDDFERYEKMGLNAGTDFITGDNFYNVRELSQRLKYNRTYAPGVEIENDNYGGGISFEQRLNRISSALFGYYLASDKLPSFMQTNDLFPLRYDTNTHHIMMANPNYSTDGSDLSHIENLFSKQDGAHYNHKVGELFAHALCR